jgi:hypothetical protein
MHARVREHGSVPYGRSGQRGHMPDKAASTSVPLLYFSFLLFILSLCLFLSFLIRQNILMHYKSYMFADVKIDVHVLHICSKMFMMCKENVHLFKVK